MKENHYQLKLEWMLDKEGNRPTGEKLLVFEVQNHDNLLELVDLVRSQNSAFSLCGDQFIIGLKLLADTIMKEKTQAPFNEMFPHLIEIIKIVKKELKK